MAKRKYTNEERQRLGIASSKRKSSGGIDRTLRIRSEYVDFEPQRSGRRTSNSQHRQDDGTLSWIGAVIVAGSLFAVVARMFE